MSPRRTTEADRHGTRRAARAAKLAPIGQTASLRGMKFARRPDEKRTATHTDRPAPAHKPGGLRTQTIFASCVRISASSVYTFASCVCIFATCEYSLSTGPGNFTSHPGDFARRSAAFPPVARAAGAKGIPAHHSGWAGKNRTNQSWNSRMPARMLTNSAYFLSLYSYYHHFTLSVS